MQHVVIVGCGVAGTQAAIQLRKISREVEVTIVEASRYTEYSRCGLPYLVSGDVESVEHLFVHTPEFYTDVLKVDLKLETRATKVDSERNVLYVESSSGKADEISYDKLIIATGSRPIVPRFARVDSDAVVNFYTLDDAVKLKKLAESASSAGVIGAGLVGMELAEALTKLGLKVDVFCLDYPLSLYLDEDMAAILEKAYPKELKVHKCTPVDAIRPKEGSVEVHAKDGKYSFDFVALCMGARPNTALAEASGIELGSLGGISVNEMLETSKRDVYAAGDCIEVVDFLGSKALLMLGSVAARQGLLAAENALGMQKEIPPQIGVKVTQLFGYEVASVGNTTAEAKRKGLSVVSTKVATYDAAECMKDKQKVWVKLLADKATGRTLGLQIIGRRGAAQRANVVSLALQKGISLQDLELLETGYAPPISPLWDPLVVAVKSINIKLRRLFPTR